MLERPSETFTPALVKAADGLVLRIETTLPLTVAVTLPLFDDAV
jgi:hypothetical protein